jgi:hypothetical protein
MNEKFSESKGFRCQVSGVREENKNLFWSFDIEI